MPKPSNDQAWMFVLPWDLHHMGGVNEVVHNLVQQSINDYRPIVLVSTWSALRMQKDPESDVPLFRLRLPAPRLDRDSLKARLLSLMAIVQLVRLIRREGIDVVNVHYVTPAIWSLALIKRWKLARFNLMVSMHGKDVEGILDNPESRPWWRSILKDVDNIVACSGNLAERFRSAFPEGTPPISVVHNGVDPHRLENAKQSVADQSFPFKAPYLVNVATFNHRKGQDVLVAAFERIAEMYPDLSLVLVGNKTEESDPILATAEKSRFRDRIFVSMNQPHGVAMRIMSNAHGFVLSSRQEPFGIVILEAAFWEVPVIASRVGGVPEIVQDGETGRLVAADDPDALAAAISGMMDDYQTALNMAGRLKRRITEEFSWENAWNRYKLVAID